MASIFWKAFFCASLAVALPLSAQEDKPAAKVDKPAAAEEQAPIKVEKPASHRRLSYGFRVEAYPLPLFKTSYATSSVTKPIADFTYTATTSSQRAAPGATIAYRLTNHISFTGEFYLQHAKYTQTATERTGKKDPNASTDDRPVTTIIQTTTANYWVAPVLVRYEHLPRLLPTLPDVPLMPKISLRRMLSHGYVAGGFEFRHVGRIRTANDITNPDLSTNYNEIAATASRANQFGALIALGLKFADEFGIKVIPEVRLIRWQGYTFEGPGYKSTPYQAEAGLGISF
jgi:hypothetical protein